MTALRALCVLLLLHSLSSVSKGQTSWELDPERARRAAEHWLALIDKFDYEAAWAAMEYRTHMFLPKDAWIDAISKYRAGLPNEVTRTEVRIEKARQSPGLIQAHYVQIQLDTRYSPSLHFKETVLVALDPNGQWHVIGYKLKNTPFDGK